MDWGETSTDQLEEAFDHFLGLSSAGLARVCELIREADVRQVFLGDGARGMVDWLSARFRLRHSTARQLVSVAHRLADLPVLGERFANGELNLDQVDAISRMATPDTEEGLIEDALALSVTALDRAARRANPPTAGDERTVWERRRLVRQWNLDESELKFFGNLPGAEGRLFDHAIEVR